MRKVILVVNTTVDGYMAGPGGDLDWMVFDPQMNYEAWVDLRFAVDTILIGRKTYQGFESTFREQAADPGSPAELVEFASWMLDTPKVVFSRTCPRWRMRARGWPRPISRLKSRRSSGSRARTW